MRTRVAFEYLLTSTLLAVECAIQRERERARAGRFPISRVTIAPRQAKEYSNDAVEAHIYLLLSVLLLVRPGGLGRLINNLLLSFQAHAMTRGRWGRKV